jgi:squalene-hopene/tetraprenyl-beta-curcumene cyclase
MSEALDGAIAAARGWLLACQHADGYWCAELGCDASVTAEGLYLRHLLGRVDPERQARTARWILRQQNPDGGWPIYHGGPSEVNASVKAYLALKLGGLDPSVEAMQAARELVLRLGGVETCHLFSLIYLAWGGLYPWEAVPRIPVEVLSAPGWLFSRYDLSYWARTIVVPLLITLAHRPVFPLPIKLDELSTGRTVSPPLSMDLPSWQCRLIDGVERLLGLYDRRPFRPLRDRTLLEAEQWMIRRFAYSDGLGAIWPAMVNAAIALVCQGHGPESPVLQEAIHQLDRLEVVEEDEAWTQPCRSPIWDTVWAIKALVSSGLDPADPALDRAGRWVLGRQSSLPADWMENTERGVPAGGWYFQHENAFYPDVDDTAVVLMALRHLPLSRESSARRQMERAIAWILGMQNADGGWGAFDRTRRTRAWLNGFSFARPFMGALLDPSTSDVSARCLESLGKLGHVSLPAMQQGIAFLRHQQEPDGSWYGRWGVNHVYGTWSALCALQAYGLAHGDPAIRQAVSYLQRTQRPDGGWGETCATYSEPEARGQGPSTPSQTAWAIMGLVAAGEAASPAAEHGVRYLMDRQRADGGWDEPDFTGTGFPNVFYLRYGLYSGYFPLLALSRYRAGQVQSLREKAMQA